MERDDFLTALQGSARDLQAKFPKRGADWVCSLCAGRSHEGKDLTVDAVYELMCCFAFVVALKTRVTDLRVIQSPDTSGFRFPMKPGAKNSFAFFCFEHEGVTYDVCCGTEVPTEKDEPPEAPDISLQKHDRALPDHDRRCGKPVALWDAKYHEDRISKSDVQQMSWWCDIFEIPKCCNGDILGSIMPGIFQVSAVLTNAPRKKINKRQLIKRRFSVVFNYLGNDSGCAPEPSRSDHLL